MRMGGRVGRRRLGLDRRLVQPARAITALAAVNIGMCDFIISGFARFLDYDPETLPEWISKSLVVMVTISQAFIN